VIEVAMAPLADIGALPAPGCDRLELPWPRPVLRVVDCAADPAAGGDDELPRTGDSAGIPVRRRSVVPVGDRGPWWAAAPELERRAAGIASSRHRRAQVRARRRRLVLGVAAAAAIAGLALPLTALGGRAAMPASTVPGTAAGTDVYVVQPGDTLWSIAERFDGGGDPRPLAEAIARETGSPSVVAGERISIP
jgi:hypothetical protein